jgi:hypothetical protein
MTSGHLFKYRVRVPLTAVAELSRKRIRLAKDLDDALDTVNEDDVRVA